MSNNSNFMEEGTASLSDSEQSLNKEIRLTRILILLTLIACGLATADIVGILVDHVRAGTVGAAVEQSVFVFIVGFLLYGNLIYQFTRLGYLKRKIDHSPADIRQLRTVFKRSGRGLTVLVPSYKEEPRVIAQTLLSAALQVCPERRVVLLIDNPPNPSDREDQHLLEKTRGLTAKLEKLLVVPAKRFNKAKADFMARRVVDCRMETRLLSVLYAEAASWFDEQARQYAATDHTDRLFVEKVFSEPAKMYRDYSESLIMIEDRQDKVLKPEQITLEYNRLAALFEVELCYFERKRYVNLSHEANKAMNLNSYIGLMGGRYSEVESGKDVFLADAKGSEASLEIPDAEFIVTLDADSIISHDYSVRLIHQVELPGNERVAVVQTPYSAIPGVSGKLERMAGATTDIQYIIHQGFTRYRATYWVGANALLRKTALEDIVTVSRERGFEVRSYIQDRTVIEDTESSVDLVDRGWSLLNYPERLAYSATPPDFGALLIQRRRWANGGLIIFPKLLRYLFRQTGTDMKLAEGLVRSHYLTSIAGVNIGLLVLFVYPFEASMTSFWLPLTVVPYFYLYGRDLVSIRYRWSDLLRVYALNLMLIPVNLGGVFKSISQGFSGKKIPFCRTPKVDGRTSVPPVYVLAVLALAVWCVGVTALDITQARWWHAAFLALNGTLFLYAINVYMGWKESFHDLGLLSVNQQEAEELLLSDGLRDDGIMVPLAVGANLQTSNDEANFDEVMIAADIIIARDAQAPSANEELAV